MSLVTDNKILSDTGVDNDIIEAVQADIREDPNRHNDYIKEWNKNNFDHTTPLKDVPNELPTKDESYKEAKWYKDAQQAASMAYEEGTWEG